MFFICGDIKGFAIDGAAGGGEDEFFNTEFKGKLEEVQATYDVDICIKEEILQGFADIYLSGVVVDDFGFFFLEDFPQSLEISYIKLIEFRFGVDILLKSRGEVIHDDDGMTELKISISYMGADEASSACY